MGVFASGALLGTIVNPLGKNLSKNSKNFNNTSSKYINFKDLFSIFFVDTYSFNIYY